VEPVADFAAPDPFPKNEEQGDGNEHSKQEYKGKYSGHENLLSFIRLQCMRNSLERKFGAQPIFISAIHPMNRLSFWVGSEIVPHEIPKKSTQNGVFLPCKLMFFSEIVI
jgi:hypothetical protein